MDEKSLHNTVTCNVCGKEFSSGEIKRKKHICDDCGFHFRIPAMERISMVVDKGSFGEWDSLMALTIIAVVIDKTGRTLASKDLRKAVTAGECC